MDFFTITAYFIAIEVTIAVGLGILERKINEVLAARNSTEEQNRLLNANKCLRDQVFQYGRTINRQGKRIHNLKVKLKTPRKLDMSEKAGDGQ
jgi:hypothetical protein